MNMAANAALLMVLASVVPAAESGPATCDLATGLPKPQHRQASPQHGKVHWVYF